MLADWTFQTQLVSFMIETAEMTTPPDGNLEQNPNSCNFKLCIRL